MPSPQTGQRIADLISEFHDSDSARRRTARLALTDMGLEAAPAVERTLQDRDPHVRWEAAATLRDIGSPESALALAQLLDDEETGIRFVVTDALIKLGERGLVATLEGAVAREPSEAFRESAERVLKHFTVPYDDIVTPVIKALDGPAARAEAPVAAGHALDALRARGIRTYEKP